MVWVDVVRGRAELADGGRVVHPTYTGLYDWDDLKSRSRNKHSMGPARDRDLGQSLLGYTLIT